MSEGKPRIREDAYTLVCEMLAEARVAERLALQAIEGGGDRDRGAKALRKARAVIERAEARLRELGEYEHESGAVPAVQEPVMPPLAERPCRREPSLS
jgi:hypothetical protein